MITTSLPLNRRFSWPTVDGKRGFFPFSWMEGRWDGSYAWRHAARRVYKCTFMLAKSHVCIVFYVRVNRIKKQTKSWWGWALSFAFIFCNTAFRFQSLQRMLIGVRICRTMTLTPTCTGWAGFQIDCGNFDQASLPGLYLFSTSCCFGLKRCSSLHCFYFLFHGLLH